MEGLCNFEFTTFWAKTSVDSRAYQNSTSDQSWHTVLGDELTSHGLTPKVFDLVKGTPRYLTNRSCLVRQVAICPSEYGFVLIFYQCHIFPPPKKNAAATGESSIGVAFDLLLSSVTDLQSHWNFRRGWKISWNLRVFWCLLFLHLSWFTSTWSSTRRMVHLKLNGWKLEDENSFWEGLFSGLC